VFHIEERFLIIDGNWLSCRAYFVPKYLNSKSGFETGGIYRFISMLNRVMKEIKPTHMIVAFDVKGENFRKKINSNYKSNRNNENKEDIYKQNDIIKDILSLIGIKYVGVSGYEADDVIGTYSKMSNANQTYILSGDKDIYQLIDDKTHIVFPEQKMKKLKIFTTEDFEKTFTIKVNQYLDFKALNGDKSDNIKGIRGIGVKNSTNLLIEFNNIDNIFLNYEFLTKSIQEKIKGNYENLKKSIHIFSIIKDVSVPYSYDDCKIKLCWENAEQVFFELDFFSFIKKLKGGSFYNV
jgi:DNA polymerase-1